MHDAGCLATDAPITFRLRNASIRSPPPLAVLANSLPAGTFWERCAALQWKARDFGDEA
jgi:hypothetical protein